MTPESIGLMYIIKTYFLTGLSILAGATAHVLEETRTDGWQGWVHALSIGFVAFFAGSMVFSFAVYVYPAYAGGLAGLGGFFGGKSITILVKVLKSFTKEL